MGDNNTLKKCGFCGESIPMGAGRCPYCGSILEVTIEGSYQIDTNQDLSNNVSEQDAAGQQSNDWQPNAVPQDQTSHYGVYGDNDAVPQEPQPQEPQPQQPQSQGPGPQPQPYRPVQGDGRSPYQNNNQNRPAYVKLPLSNGLKVFLTIIFTMIPGFGQIAGIITAIVFMSSADQDRKSFGIAILVACAVLFTISCIVCFIASIAASQEFPSMY